MNLKNNDFKFNNIVFPAPVISRMLKIKDVGLPNLLLGERIYKELIQNDCNVDNIIQAVEETKNSIPETIKNSELLRNMLKGKGNSEAVKTITVL